MAMARTVRLRCNNKSMIASSWLTRVSIACGVVCVRMVLANEDESDNNESESSSSSAGIGMMLGLFGGIIDNVGVCFQKLSHRKHSNEDKPYFKQTLWIFGFSMYLFGTAMNAIGLSLAPQSEFALLGTLGLVTNAINSRLILKEELNKLIIAGTGVVIVGSLIAMLFGNHSSRSKALQLSDLGNLFISAGFVVYAIFIALFLLSLRIVIRVLERRTASRRILDIVPDDKPDLDVGVSNGGLPSGFDEIELEPMGEAIGPVLMDQVEEPGNKMDEPLVEEKRIQFLLGASTFRNHAKKFFLDKGLSIAYPFYAGTIGSITQILAKCTSELIKATGHGYPSFAKVQTYLIIISTISLAAHQVHWINLSLKRFDQLVVVPVFAVALESFNVIGGGIFFQELTGFTIVQAIMFPIAIVISYTGVLIITMGNHKKRSKPDNLQSSRADVRQSSEYEEPIHAESEPKDGPKVPEYNPEELPPASPVHHGSDDTGVDDASGGSVSDGADGNDDVGPNGDNESRGGVAEADELSYAVEANADPQPAAS